MTHVLASVSGFAPAGLIAKLKRSRWSKADDGSVNFLALGLGGYCLTSPSDDLCPVHYRVVVTESGGGCFQVVGYGFPNMPRAVMERQGMIAIRRHELLPASGDGLVPYTIEIHPAGN